MMVNVGSSVEKHGKVGVPWSVGYFADIAFALALWSILFPTDALLSHNQLKKIHLVRWLEIKKLLKANWTQVLSSCSHTDLA